MSPESPTLPLTGTLILDASRMLPGAVLARMLIELGGRLIKIEEPASGDSLRAAPPFVDGTGSGFDEFYLVQMAQPGAVLYTSEATIRIEDPTSASAV